MDVKIEWTEATWNPIFGCTRKSLACKHCYAETTTAENAGPGQWGQGFAEPGGGWTGKVEVQADRLPQPLGWTEPKRIFVNSLADLFHENLAKDQIDRVFAIMALSPDHTFQVLTKRPKQMQDYMSDPATPGRIEAAMAAFAMIKPPRSIATWPLPNVWLGVTAENQKEADRRIPLLLATPAALRFVAAEPLLDTIDLKVGSWLPGEDGGKESAAEGAKLDWIVGGGEGLARSMQQGWHALLLEPFWRACPARRCGPADRRCAA
jgi:protein gp37